MKKIILTVIISSLGLTLAAQSYKGKSAVNKLDNLNNAYCSGIFKNSEGTILDLTNDNNTVINYVNILDWMQGRVAGLRIYKLSNGISIPFIRGSQAMIFLDEIPVTAGLMATISTSYIAMIKVFKPPFTGSFGNSPAIAIYTFKADEEVE